MSNLNTKIFVAVAALIAATGCVNQDEETVDVEGQEEVQADPASTEQGEVTTAETASQTGNKTTNTETEGDASSQTESE